MARCFFSFFLSAIFLRSFLGPRSKLVSKFRQVRILEDSSRQYKLSRPKETIMETCTICDRPFLREHAFESDIGILCPPCQVDRIRWPIWWCEGEDPVRFARELSEVYRNYILHYTLPSTPLPHTIHKENQEHCFCFWKPTPEVEIPVKEFLKKAKI